MIVMRIMEINSIIILIIAIIFGLLENGFIKQLGVKSKVIRENEERQLRHQQ